MSAPHGIYTPRLKDIIDERLGVSEFVRPITHTIEVVFLPNIDEVYKYSFDEVFLRLPPFEPIAIKPSIYGQVELKGDYVWFITSIENLNNKESLSKVYKIVEEQYRGNIPGIKCREIICGEYEDIGTGIILKRLYIPRIVGDGKSKWSKEVELQLNDRTVIKIIYGFTHETLRNWIRTIKERFSSRGVYDKEIIQILSSPEKALKFTEIIQKFEEIEKKSGSYAPTTLNYVSSCYGGRVLTTDPFSNGKKCDECKDKSRGTLLCRDIPGYGIYHWRRRIFPRVYASPRNAVASYNVDDLGRYYRVPFVCIFTEGVRCVKKLESLDIQFDIGRVRLKLAKPIISDYFNTNAFLVVINRQLIEAFTNIIKKSASNIYCFVPTCGSSTKIPLINLLVSKFIWKNISMQEYNYDIDLKFDDNANKLQVIVKVGDDEFQVLYSENVNKLVERIAESNDFVKFVLESLTHTLAHSIYIGLSNIIPYFDEYGAYISHVDKNYVIAGGIENTRGGTLKLLRPSAEILSSERYFEDTEKGLMVFKPSSIIKIVKDVIEIVGKIESPKGVEEICKVKVENIERIASAVLSRLKEESSEEPSVGSTKKGRKYMILAQNQGLVRQIIKVMIGMFEELIQEILNAGMYIDRYAFTSVILWKVLRDLTIRGNIIKGVKYRVRNIDEFNSIPDSELDELIDLIFDVLIEVEMSTIITNILLPDYCSDGCEADLHLPRCSKALEQPYIISRCLLITFLRFAGIPVYAPQLEIERFECGGSELKTLSMLARDRLRILTHVLGDDGVKILSEILSNKQDLKIAIEIDKRFKEQNLEIVRKLEELESKYKRRLNVIYTTEPHHGKMIVIDFLKVITSWNFGSGERVRQLYISELQ
uniref:Uncharacterized protein n=1 Tax=Ignisphaera aggregans TaxID=334771 RepID=A0A7J2TAK3_9CREN